MLKITELIGQKARLKHLNNINIVMGRNGSGKSRFLRDIEDNLSRNKDAYHVRYISPERGGSFKREGNIITYMTNPNWLRESRALNQAASFKATSAVLFRDAETIYLRRLQSTEKIRMDMNRSFQADRMTKINQLLTNIYMGMGQTDFEFRSLSDDGIIEADKISSGESEAVALASEILYFFDTLEPKKFNVLLLDEPDVHLHADLQGRLGRLIVEMLDEFKEHAPNIAVCLATHSSPLVCSLADSEYVSIGTKSFDTDTVELKQASTRLRDIAPFFGHPLSLALSEDAPLIVEGEDDERVWQQAGRTSQSRIRIFPVIAGTKDRQSKLEEHCAELLSNLYDNPVAFSVRDGDGVVDKPLEHREPIKRYRLKCYAIENALLTDPCLVLMGSDWNGLVAAAKQWLDENKKHQDVASVSQLIESKDRQRHKKIKQIRQLICSILGRTKPWEVVVGQAIGNLTREDLTNSNMLVDFLGEEMVREVVFRNME